MKKLLKLGAALVVLSLLFAACPTTSDGGGGGGDGEVTPPSVTGIVLHMSGENGTGDYTTKQDVNPNGSYRIFWAVVQGNKSSDGKTDYDKTYTLTITGDTADVVASEADDTSKGAGGKKVTFKDDNTLKDKQITVTATAIGDTSRTANFVIKVDADVVVLTGPDFSNAQWVIRNTVLDRGRNIDSKTTNTVTGVNGALDSAQKRYVVFNNEPGATIDNQTPLGGNCFRDVTVMYLNVPIPADTDGFIPFGIQARIRITGHRDSTSVFGATGDESWGSGRQGLIMGYINDPAASDFGQTFASTDAEAATTTPDTAPFFNGFRILSSGQHRIYSRRPGTGGYGSAQLTPTPSSGDVNLDIPGTTIKYQAQLELHDYVNGSTTLNTAKKEGFMDQEYVVKVVRSGASMHYFEVYDTTGETMLFSCHPSGGSNYPGTEMSDKSNYLAFLVYGVKAEISDIKVFYDDEQVWEDPAVKDAQPAPLTAKRVDITITTPDGKPQLLPGDTENNYSIVGTSFPTTGVPISAEVVPLTLPAASKAVNWTVEGPGSLIWDEGAIYQDTPVVYGKNTFTATAAGSAVSSSVKFWAKDPADVVDPTSVTIDTPAKTSLKDGEKLTLTAVVGPAGADPYVTWSITMADGTTPVDKKVAYIQPNTGELRAYTAAADTVINVYATAKGTSVVSTAQSMTILQSTGVYRVWRFGEGSLTYEEGAEGDVVTEGAKTGTPWVDTSNTNVNDKALTLPGGLTLNPASANGARWDPTQPWPSAWNETGYPDADKNKGAYQPVFGTDASPYFKIMDFGVPVKVTVIWAHTGNNLGVNYPDISGSGTLTTDRGMGIKFGSAATKWNPVTSGENGITTSILNLAGTWTANQASIYANAVWSEEGTGEVILYGINLNGDPAITTGNKGKPGDKANDNAAAVRIFEIKVEPGEGGSSGPALPQIWRTNIGTANGTASVSGEKLTMSGIGGISQTGQEFNFVYLPVAGDFTMTVKVESAIFGSTANGGRIGLIAIPKSAATSQNTSTGVLAGVATDNTLLLAGTTIRADASMGRMSRAVTGNSSFSAITGAPSAIPGNGSPPAAAVYLKLRRVTNAFYMTFSTDGATWITEGNNTVAMDTNTYVGLFVGSSNTTATTVIFDDWRLVDGNGNASSAQLSAVDPIDFDWLK